MRKSTIFAVIAIFAIIAAFYACQKDEAIIKDANNNSENLTNKIGVVDNRLVFENRKDYEQTINYLAKIGDDKFAKWDDELGFNSMRSKFKNNLDKMPVDDELLATLLNADGIVQIGEYIFKVDVPNEKVYMTYKSDNCEQDLKNINNLKSGNIDKSDVREFSTEDDVLDILYNDNTESQLKHKSTYCNSNKKGYYSWNSYYGSIKYKIVYQNAGIYHSLQAKIKKDKGGAEYLSISTVDDNINSKYIQPGPGGGGGGSHYTYCYNFYKNRNECKPFKGYVKKGTGRVYNIRPYSSTCRLKAYRFCVFYYMSDPYYNTTQSATLQIECNLSDKCQYVY